MVPGIAIDIVTKTTVALSVFAHASAPTANGTSDVNTKRINANAISASTASLNDSKNDFRSAIAQPSGHTNEMWGDATIPPMYRGRSIFAGRDGARSRQAPGHQPRNRSSQAPAI